MPEYTLSTDLSKKTLPLVALDRRLQRRVRRVRRFVQGDLPSHGTQANARFTGRTRARLLMKSYGACSSPANELRGHALAANFSIDGVPEET